jgi:hypothetical protein
LREVKKMDRIDMARVKSVRRRAGRFIFQVTVL